MVIVAFYWDYYQFCLLRIFMKDKDAKKIFNVKGAYFTYGAKDALVSLVW